MRHHAGPRTHPALQPARGAHGRARCAGPTTPSALPLLCSCSATLAMLCIDQADQTSRQRALGVALAGEDAIRHLLSRGTHREFGYTPLLLMLVFYFCGAAVIAGSALSTGLFVPMLLIGCLVGELHCTSGLGPGLANVDALRDQSCQPSPCVCVLVNRPRRLTTMMCCPGPQGASWG